MCAGAAWATCLGVVACASGGGGRVSRECEAGPVSIAPACACTVRCPWEVVLVATAGQQWCLRTILQVGNWSRRAPPRVYFQRELSHLVRESGHSPQPSSLDRARTRRPRAICCMHRSRVTCSSRASLPLSNVYPKNQQVDPPGPPIALRCCVYSSWRPLARRGYPDAVEYSSPHNSPRPTATLPLAPLTREKKPILSCIPTVSSKASRLESLSRAVHGSTCAIIQGLRPVLSPQP